MGPHFVGTIYSTAAANGLVTFRIYMIVWLHKIIFFINLDIKYTYTRLLRHEDIYI